MELTRLKISKSWPESLYDNKSTFLPEALDEYETRLVRLRLIVNERGIVPFFLQDEVMGGKIVNDRATGSELFTKLHAGYRSVKIHCYPIFILTDVKTPVYKNAVFLVMPLRSTCFEDGFCNLQPLPFVRIIFHPAVHAISEWNPSKSKWLNIVGRLLSDS